jgi:hypothetical protein
MDSQYSVVLVAFTLEFDIIFFTDVFLFIKNWESYCTLTLSHLGTDYLFLEKKGTGDLKCWMEK